MGPRLLLALIFFHCLLSGLSQLVFKRVSLDEADPVPRIVNGVPAKLGDVPYQVAFKQMSRRRLYVTFCGGVIIKKKTILTAAHCFDSSSWFSSDCSGGSKKVSKKKLRAYAVAGNLWNQAGHPGQKRSQRKQASNITKYSQRYQLSQHSHGQWRSLARGVYPNKYNFPKNDIALIWTRNPFQYNDYVTFIPIATVHKEYTMKCLASGYGRLSTTAKVSTTTLLLADLEIIPTSVCNKMHRKNMHHFVCTSTAVSDVAQGDSGGPLVCKNTNDPNDKDKRGVVVGIVSGARIGVGSFFTRVSSYKSWIEKGSAAMNGSSIVCLTLTIYATFYLF